MSDTPNPSTAIPEQSQPVPIAVEAPVPAPTPTPASTDAPATPAIPGRATLSDGTVVEMRRMSGLDTSRAENLMQEAGFRYFEGPGQITYLRCMAVYAIKSKDGKTVVPPTTPDALTAELSTYFEDDLALIVYAYQTLSAQAGGRTAQAGTRSFRG